jgi:dUTP pyrophosphatase
MIHVKRLPHAEGLPLPEYATPNASGVDLLAAIERDVILYPGDRKLIPTGLCVAILDGFEIQIRPRSGLALRNGIFVLNTPGTIDADYRGEISVLLQNMSDKPFTVERGMRIAQAVLAPVARIDWQIVGDLSNTKRGVGGFGSTGT